LHRQSDSPFNSFLAGSTKFKAVDFSIPAPSASYNTATYLILFSLGFVSKLPSGA
jgi:hypothetical protein